MSSADQRGSQGVRGVSWKGKTLSLEQNLPIDGSVRVGSHPKGRFLGACLSGTPEMKVFC